MADTALERRSATWAEYEALGETHWTEYIDGEIVVNPPPGIRHQLAARRLANVLEAALPEDYTVIEGAGWKPGASEYVPDVMVVRTADIDSDVRFTGTPVLCVEILSSNRSHDQVTKMAVYAEAGLPNYWILDPLLDALDVMQLDGNHYQWVATLTAVPGVAVVDGREILVDVGALLA